METTIITIPHWRKAAGTETEVDWVTLDEKGCENKQNILRFFNVSNQDRRGLYGIFEANGMINELLSCSKARGIFATYKRNYSYLEDKGDINTEMPTEDDRFRIAGFAIGMPVSQERLEKMLRLRTRDLRSLFASGASEIFYYETWINIRYKEKLRKLIEEFVVQESRRLFLQNVTVETEKLVLTKNTILCNMNLFSTF